MEEALAAYDQLFALRPGDADVKAARKTQREWKLKNEAHPKERDYLLKTWPAVATIQDFKESLARVRTAVDVCKKHGRQMDATKATHRVQHGGGEARTISWHRWTQRTKPTASFCRASGVNKAIAVLEAELRKIVEE